MSLNCDDVNSYLFVNGEKIYNFKANNKNVNFPNQFCLGSMCNKFGEVEEVSLKGNVYDFLVDDNGIDKPDILKIFTYLMVKNNIKQGLGLLNKCLLNYRVLADIQLALLILLALQNAYP